MLRKRLIISVIWKYIFKKIKIYCNLYVPIVFYFVIGCYLYNENIIVRHDEQFSSLMNNTSNTSLHCVH